MLLPKHTTVPALYVIASWFHALLFSQGTVFLDPIVPSAQIEVTSNIAYDSNGNVLTVREPVSELLPDKRPALVYFPGGNGQGIGVTPAPDYCAEFASRGYVTFAATYRALNPSDKIEDAANAIKWVLDRVDQYKIDPERIIAGGHSHGGAVSIDVSTLRKDDFDNLGVEVAGALICSPGIDTFAGNLTTRMNHIDEDGPPLFIVHGDADTIALVDGTRTELIGRLDALADSSPGYLYPYSYLELPGESHFFTAAFNGWNTTSLAGKTVAQHCFEFFFEHLNLLEILIDNPDVFANGSEFQNGAESLKLFVKQDNRITYKATSTEVFDSWGIIPEVPVINGEMLEVEIPLSGAKGFFRWELSADYPELTSDDYDASWEL
ncbi:MAG: alpha/beta hydrolase [Opitutales bacterium]